MKSGPTPAFVLARVCAPAAQAWLPVSDTGSAHPAQRHRRRDRSISGRQPGRRRARYRVAKHSRSFGSPCDHFVANALIGMRLPG